jgi:hypothetical protein
VNGKAIIATEWLIEYMCQKYKNLTLFADVVVDNVANSIDKYTWQQYDYDKKTCYNDKYTWRKL